MTNQETFKHIKAGDSITYGNYGSLYRGRVIALLRGHIVHIEKLDGPLIGSFGWIHTDSIVKG